MAQSFEKFMSGIEEGETRTAEMKEAYEEQHGEPYPDSNGVGEKVGLPDSALEEKPKEKDIKPVVTPEEFGRKKEESLAQVRKEAEVHPDWPPAAGNPEAEASLSKDLEAGMNTL